MSKQENEILEHEIDKDENLKTLIEKAAKSKLLTKEEENELFKKVEQGDKSAEKELVEAHLKFVINVALKFEGHNVPLEQLINEGVLALKTAVKRFDCQKDIRFSTYAIWWIRQAIMRTLIGKLSNMLYEISHKLQRNPTIKEISEAFNMPEEEVKHLLPSLIYHHEEILLLRDILGCDDIEPINSIDEEINYLFSRLAPKEREIIKLRYGLKDGRRHNAKEIGEKLEIDQEIVEQIEIEALARLRHWGELEIERRLNSVETSEEKININTAKAEQLMPLFGIKVLIHLLEYRQEHGKFDKIEDIMKIKGIGKKTFEKVKDKICL